MVFVPLPVELDENEDEAVLEAGVVVCLPRRPMHLDKALTILQMTNKQSTIVLVDFAPTLTLYLSASNSSTMVLVHFAKNPGRFNLGHCLVKVNWPKKCSPQN